MQFESEDRRCIIKIPEIFSLIHNPEETVDILFSLVDVSRNGRIEELFFDHSEIREWDMGANAILDVIALNIWNEWKAQGRRFSFGGRFPSNSLLQEVIKSMGITKHLSIKDAEPSKEVEDLFVRFPLHKGYRQRGSELGGQQHREKAASQLVKYLNECLIKASDFCLKDEGKRQILKWAGEIITNAEEHSGQNQWWVAGCMIPSIAKHGNSSTESERLIGECQLTIFGFGSSIYESLLKASEETKNQIDALASKHIPFFRLFPKYTDKDLWTLYALQDGVSRFSSAPGSNTRGKGTVEMIEAFQTLGRSVDPQFQPEMTLISGSSRIYFDEKYHLKEEEVHGGRRKIIAFNERNNLEDKPDAGHVSSISGHFPGTVLTFKFFVDNQYLEKYYAKINESKNARND